MTTRRILAAALAVVLLGAAPKPHAHHKRPAPPRQTVYSAPQGAVLSKAPNPATPFDAYLPNGRVVAPVGTNAIVGSDARGVALSPDGKYAIVGTDAGVTVVDTSSMRVVGAFEIAGGVSPGVAAVVDPADGSKTLVLVAGRTDDRLHLLDVNPDGTTVSTGDPLAMPPSDGLPADDPFVSAISVSTDGRSAYVAHRGGDAVSAIDIVQRRVLSDTIVGFAPAGIAIAGNRLFVTNEGVVPSADPDRSSSLDALTLQTDGDIDGDSGSAVAVRLDPLPDGTTTVGGAHPSALTTSPDGRYAFICMTGVDRVEVVDLDGTPHAAGGISMQLYTGWPYGTQPVALAASADGKRLYVALAGINAIAIIDSSNPLKLRRLGLIPTGWYPGALALSGDGRYLFVSNAKGTPQLAGATLQRIDLHGLQAGPVTLSALRYNRVATFAKINTLVPPIQSKRHSDAIDSVIFIDADGATMPNLAALARAFASSANFSPDSSDRDDASQFALAGVVTPYELTARNSTPSAYPRAGYLFDSLSREGMSYRDYGSLSGLPALTGHEGAAGAFVADFGTLVDSDAVPAFTAVRLPSDDDAALGSIVDYLTHTPQWSRMAIFIVDRGQAVLVSPYARRGYFGFKHLSTVSVLKTEEELLGLPALSLNDLLASDMADFFTPVADSASFVAVGVEHSASQ